jgi:hypothetical protein
MTTNDESRPPRQTRTTPERGTEELRQQAGAAAQQAAQIGRAQLDRQRNVAADRIDALAETAQQGASQLSDQDQAGIAHMLGDAASAMHGLAENLRNKSADELLHEAGRIARQNPTLFIAGSIAIGLGIARFAKASAQHQHSTAQPHHHADWGASAAPRHDAAGDLEDSLRTGLGGAPYAGDADVGRPPEPSRPSRDSGTPARNLTGGPQP